MSGKRRKRKGRDPIGDALAMAAEAERALLRDERRAERRLEVARAKLTKAQERLERRIADVRDAECALLSRQAARARGPILETAPAEFDSRTDL